MELELKNFLDTLTPADFKGSETAPKIKRKAKKYLNTTMYGEYEVYNSIDIHLCLLCLIYDNI